MHHLKRKALLSLLLAGTMAASSFLVSGTYVRATERTNVIQGKRHTATMQLYQQGDFPEISNTFTYKSQIYAAGPYNASITTAQQALYDGMRNAEENIDLTPYHLTPKQLSTYIQDISNTCPDLFYVDKNFSYYLDNTDHVTSVIPIYTMNGTELQEAKAFYDSSIQAIVSQVDSSWSDLEKILFVHDYLAQNFMYDTRAYDANLYDQAIHDTYQFFKQKIGVCQSYTLTFVAVMDQLGIETSVAVSNSMNHIWNVVKLNGRWYHIDNTWDDTLQNGNDLLGRANHDYVLLSDASIATRRGTSTQIHENWSCPYSCTDTTYDSYFWEDSSSPFQCLNNTWYYAAYDAAKAEGILYTYDFKTNTKAQAASLGKWFISNNSYYQSCYCGLDVYDQKLYYNDASKVYIYDPETNSTSELTQPSANGSIYGMYIEGQTLNYTATTSTIENRSNYTYTLPAAIHTPTPEPTPTPKPTPTPTPIPLTEAELGDATRDGSIDLSDVQLVLRKYLDLASEEEALTELCDVNKDGSVDLTDVQLILQKYLDLIDEFPVPDEPESSIRPTDEPEASNEADEPDVPAPAEEDTESNTPLQATGYQACNAAEQRGI